MLTGRYYRYRVFRRPQVSLRVGVGEPLQVSSKFVPTDIVEPIGPGRPVADLTQREGAEQTADEDRVIGGDEGAALIRRIDPQLGDTGRGVVHHGDGVPRVEAERARPRLVRAGRHRVVDR